MATFQSAWLQLDISPCTFTSQIQLYTVYRESTTEEKFCELPSLS